ncbi:hypothetical protein D3C77_282710 [compost metagenome]
MDSGACCGVAMLGWRRLAAPPIAAPSTAPWPAALPTPWPNGLPSARFCATCSWADCSDSSPVSKPAPTPSRPNIPRPTWGAAAPLKMASRSELPKRPARPAEPAPIRPVRAPEPSAAAVCPNVRSPVCCTVFAACWPAAASPSPVPAPTRPAAGAVIPSALAPSPTPLPATPPTTIVGTDSRI